MKNFFRLITGAPVLPLLAAVARQPELWDQNTLRTRHPGTAHSEISDIWLMFNQITEEIEKVIDDRIVFPYEGWHKLPQARPLIFDMMRLVEGTHLGRVIITKLPPGKKIDAHVDGGAPATYFKRYQVVLQSLPGAIFRIEDETVNFNTGDIWMIDNTKEHEVINNSKEDRIVMIVDIRS